MTVPVRPGYEQAVADFMNKGVVPTEADLLSGAVTTGLYVPFFAEVTGVDGGPDTVVPYGDPPVEWELRVPTTLVKVRTDNTLPKWASDTWAPVNPGDWKLRRSHAAWNGRVAKRAGGSEALLPREILRGLYGKHPGWDLGTPPSTGDSFCARLQYQKPSMPSCEEVSRYPVTPKRSDETIFSRLARMQVVANQPERQAEVFGWVTPSKNDIAGQQAFEIAKARYWAAPIRTLRCPLPPSPNPSRSFTCSRIRRTSMRTTCCA